MYCRDNDNNTDAALRFKSPPGGPSLRTRAVEAALCAHVERFGDLPRGSTWAEVMECDPMLGRTEAVATSRVIAVVDAGFLAAFTQRLAPHCCWLFGGGRGGDLAARVLCRDLDALLRGCVGTAVGYGFRFVALSYSGERLAGAGGSEKLTPAEHALAESLRRVGGDESAWPYGTRRAFVVRLFDCRPATAGPVTAWLTYHGDGEPADVGADALGDFQHVVVDEDGNTVLPPGATAPASA